jgi:hypothetical protein
MERLALRNKLMDTGYKLLHACTATVIYLWQYIKYIAFLTLRLTRHGSINAAGFNVKSRVMRRCWWTILRLAYFCVGRCTWYDELGSVECTIYFFFSILIQQEFTDMDQSSIGAYHQLPGLWRAEIIHKMVFNSSLWEWIQSNTTPSRDEKTNTVR